MRNFLLTFISRVASLRLATSISRSSVSFCLLSMMPCFFPSASRHSILTGGNEFSVDYSQRISPSSPVVCSKEDMNDRTQEACSKRRFND